jgi:hypothetical protein
MILRAFDGSLVEIKRSKYKDDKEYYETIMNVVLGKRQQSKSISFTSKAVDIIRKIPYK